MREPLDQLTGGGNLQITNGSAYGEPFKSLQADIRFTGDDAQISRLHFSQDGGVIDGTATYDLPTKALPPISVAPDSASLISSSCKKGIRI